MRTKIIFTVTFISLVVFWGVYVGDGRELAPSFLAFLGVESILLIGIFERRAPFFGGVIWKSPTDQPVIALTFDDGPNEPYTSMILDILKKHGVRATFFVVGENAERYPETLRRAVAEGHELGNHTWNHEVLPLKSPTYIHDQVARVSALIHRHTGTSPRLFRAPHGWRNPWVNRAVKRAGCVPVAWTLGVWDTDRPGTANVIARTMKGLKNGCCVLLHDGRGVESNPDVSQVVEALPVIIEAAREKGYRFTTFSELIDLGGG